MTHYFLSIPSFKLFYYKIYTKRIMCKKTLWIIKWTPVYSPPNLINYYQSLVAISLDFINNPCAFPHCFISCVCIPKKYSSTCLFSKCVNWNILRICGFFCFGSMLIFFEIHAYWCILSVVCSFSLLYTIPFCDYIMMSGRKSSVLLLFRIILALCISI